MLKQGQPVVGQSLAAGTGDPRLQQRHGMCSSSLPVPSMHARSVLLHGSGAPRAAKQQRRCEHTGTGVIRLHRWLGARRSMWLALKAEFRPV